MIPVTLNENHLDMELDTGAAISVISEITFNAVLKDSSIIQSSDLTLRTYLGKELPVLGTVHVTVGYESQKASLPLVIVKGQGASLFGRNWLDHIRLDWLSINAVQTDTAVQGIIDTYPGLFSSQLGTIRGAEAKRFMSRRMLHQDFTNPVLLPTHLSLKWNRNLIV